MTLSKYLPYAALMGLMLALAYSIGYVFIQGPIMWVPAGFAVILAGLIITNSDTLHTLWIRRGTPELGSTSSVGTGPAAPTRIERLATEREALYNVEPYRR